MHKSRNTNMSMMAAMAAASHAANMSLSQRATCLPPVTGPLLDRHLIAMASELGLCPPPASPFDARGPRSEPKSIPQAERAKRKRKEKIAAKSRKRNRR